MCTAPRTPPRNRSAGAVRTNRCRIDDRASYAIGHGHMCADELPGWHNPCDLHKFYLLLYVSFTQLSCHLTVQDLCCISTCKPEQYTVTSCLQTCMTSCHMSAKELPSSETSINSQCSASYAALRFRQISIGRLSNSSSMPYQHLPALQDRLNKAMRIRALSCSSRHDYSGSLPISTLLADFLLLGAAAAFFLMSCCASIAGISALMSCSALALRCLLILGLASGTIFCCCVWPLQLFCKLLRLPMFQRDISAGLWLSLHCYIGCSFCDLALTPAALAFCYSPTFCSVLFFDFAVGHCCVLCSCGLPPFACCGLCFILASVMTPSEQVLPLLAAQTPPLCSCSQ